MKRIIPTFEQYLFEDPDAVYATKPHTIWRDGGLAFGYSDEEMLVSAPCVMHCELENQMNRNDFGTPGRLWPEKKIISFWKLQKPLDKVIKDINKTLKDRKIKVDSSWSIDVCSYRMLKTAKEPREASTLKSLSAVMREVKSEDSNEDYTISWEDAHDMYYTIHNV